MERVSGFSSSSVSRSFGASGEKTVEKMTEALTEFNGNLRLEYIENKKEFHVINSSEISQQAMAEIFNSKCYKAWVPQVQLERDEQGNLVVTLLDKARECFMIGDCFAPERGYR